MASLKTVVTAGLLTSGLALSAQAADYPSRSMETEPVVAELGTGWYLRGDVGYVAYLKVEEEPHGLPDRSLRENVKLEDTFSVGGGIGYKFNNWLRTDATVDYRDSAKFRSSSTLGGPSPLNQGFSNQRAEFESITAMFNAYLELGVWSGVTPYIGAGVGVAQNRFHRHTSQDTVFFGPPAHPRYQPTGPSGTEPFLLPLNRHETKTEYDLAWALMGGVSVDVGHGFLVDLGYRYVNLGHARTYVLDADHGIKTKALDAHEGRFGLRYMID